MRRIAVWIAIPSALAAAGLGLAAAASAHHEDAVAPWHHDGRRPAGHLLDGAGAGTVDAWHKDARRPRGKQGEGTTGGVLPWKNDSRRPDGQKAGGAEKRVEWWRIDDRRPAPWPKADMDSDGDGVMDRADMCPDTPAGVAVDDKGCPSDSDGDGVPDGIDRCPGTPRGTAVDASGCARDSDGDGVPDDKDKCPNTPAGTRVDVRGCTVSGMEAELLDTGKLRLQNVYFDLNKATIKPESYEALDAAGEVLSKWPELRIEVGGHTDGSGADDYNQKLSQTRAEAVLAYLTSKFSSIHKDQYTTKGYGESQPVATNDTPEGRAQNRRVEFTVLNREALRK